MIKIGNITLGDEGEYCGRPSPLGNPFPIHGQMTRDIVCDMYERWFMKEIEDNNIEIIKELKRLDYLHKEKGEITLLCFCSPLRCHCETIKKVLEDGLYVQ